MFWFSDESEIKYTTHEIVCVAAVKRSVKAQSSPALLACELRFEDDG